MKSRKKITQYRSILESDRKLISLIRKELLEIREKYGIDRRSDIQGEVEEIKVNLEVMVGAEDVLLTLSKDGYVKRTGMLSFTRSGGARSASGVKEGDYVTQLLDVNTLDVLLVFTQRGQYFLLPVHQVPEYKWKEPGTPIVNVIPLTKDDRIVSVIPIKNMEEIGKSLVFVTKKGQVKRTELKDYATKRSSAVAACKVAGDDEVLSVTLSDGTRDIMLITRAGMSIRFKEQEVNAMGRVSAGVKGIQLAEGDEIVAALWVEEDEGEVLVLTESGYGKRTLLLDYPAQGRGGKGITTFEFKEGKRVRSNGTRIVAAFYCREAIQLFAITADGQTMSFLSEKAPLTDRKDTGKLLAPVEKKDEIVNVLPRSEPQASQSIE